MLRFWLSVYYWYNLSWHSNYNSRRWSRPLSTDRPNPRPWTAPAPSSTPAPLPSSRSSSPKFFSSSSSLSSESSCPKTGLRFSLLSEQDSSSGSQKIWEDCTCKLHGTLTARAKKMYGYTRPISNVRSDTNKSFGIRRSSMRWDSYAHLS